MGLTLTGLVTVSLPILWVVTIALGVWMINIASQGSAWALGKRLIGLEASILYSVVVKLGLCLYSAWRLWQERRTCYTIPITESNQA